MTTEEQQQVNAMMRFYEAQIANLTREGAQAAGVAERFAIKLKEAEARIKLLDKQPSEDNVVPITPAA